MASDRQYEDFDFDFGVGRQSVHNLIATVPPSRWDLYFAKMREFAKENNFKIRIARLKPDHGIFFVDLWRNDVAMMGGNVFDTPDFHTHVYIDPVKGATNDMADALVERMKVLLTKVPGTTIKQTK